MSPNDGLQAESEAWRPIDGFEGLYEVSNAGRIRRVGKAARNGNGRGGGATIGRILTPQQSSRNGYLSIQLWSNGKPKMYLVHVLVASAFLGPCPDGLEVNHADGNKQNAAAYNLEYMTHSENNKHAYRTGLRVVTDKQRAAITRPRKSRVLIQCGCGCGAQLENLDRQARPRAFLPGHFTKLRMQQKALSNE